MLPVKDKVAANVIDWNASYNNEDNARTPAGLNYLNGVDTYTEDNYTEADCAMSNIGGDGSIVPPSRRISWRSLQR